MHLSTRSSACVQPTQRSTGCSNLQPLDPPWTYPENIVLGTVGAEIEVGRSSMGGAMCTCSMRRPLKIWIRLGFPRHTIRSLRSASAI